MTNPLVISNRVRAVSRVKAAVVVADGVVGVDAVVVGAAAVVDVQKTSVRNPRVVRLPLRSANRSSPRQLMAKSKCTATAWAMARCS